MDSGGPGVREHLHRRCLFLSPEKSTQIIKKSLKWNFTHLMFYYELTQVILNEGLLALCKIMIFFSYSLFFLISNRLKFHCGYLEIKTIVSLL
jgi:hypothetical protein